MALCALLIGATSALAQASDGGTADSFVDPFAGSRVPSAAVALTAPTAPPPMPSPVEPLDSKRSVGASTFGIRVGFGGAVVALPTAAITTSTTVLAPMVGAAFMVGDGFKLLLDVAGAYAVNTSAQSSVYSVGAGLGVEYLFRSTRDAFRPLVQVGADIAVGASSSDPLVSFGFRVAGGAEYFFSPNFSVSGRIGIAVPLSLPAGHLVLGLFTFAPGLGAAFYF